MLIKVKKFILTYHSLRLRNLTILLQLHCKNAGWIESLKTIFIAINKKSSFSALPLFMILMSGEIYFMQFYWANETG